MTPSGDAAYPGAGGDSGRYEVGRCESGHVHLGDGSQKRGGADEVEQLHIHQRWGTSTRPVRELKGFRRVALAAGATQLRYRSDVTQGFVQDATVLDVWIGGGSDAALGIELEVVAGG